MAALAPFVPMMLGVAGGLLAMLLAAWGRRGLSIACSLAGLAAGAFAAGWSGLGAPTVVPIGSGSAYSLPVVACLALGAIALAVSFRTLLMTPAGPRVAVLSAFAASAAALVSVSFDLGLLFLGVESLALCGYGIVALGGSERAREAAMKWFVQGAVATAVFIVGIGVLLSRTAGSLAYADVAQAATDSGSAAPIAVGLALVLSALAFKAGAFPFHSWMPDAFETAPPAGAAVLASAGKVGPIVAIVWLASTVIGTGGGRGLAVTTLLAVGSIVFGNLAALRQRDLARMLAYSGVAQVGYALVAVGLPSGAGPVLIFAVLYGLSALASFLFIVALHEVEPGWDGSVGGLAGLSHRRPALAGALVVIMLSLTGIPLTAGFWGKFMVFAVAAIGGQAWLAVLAMLGSVVSFGYYGGAVRAAFMAQGPEGEAASEAVSPTQAGPARLRGYSTLAVFVLAVFLVVIGVLPLVADLGLLT